LNTGAPATAWFVRLTSPGRLPSPGDLADLLGSHGIWLQRSSCVDTRTGHQSAYALTWPAVRPCIERALSALSAASRAEAFAIRALEGRR
jgi:hypothetical protein